MVVVIFFYYYWEGGTFLCANHSTETAHKSLFRQRIIRDNQKTFCVLR